MAKKNSEPDPLADLNDLLDSDTEDFDAVIEEVQAAPEAADETEPEVADDDLPIDNAPAAPAARVETAEQRRIRELREELAKPDVLAPTTDVEGKPLSEDELTEEQREIRLLEDQLAKKKAKALEAAPDQYDDSKGAETVLIHIVEDGFTALGRTWFTGQEIEFVIGGRAHKDTFDRTGKSWLDFNDREQIAAYGRVYFRQGEWPGLDYDDSDAARAERKRNRAAPILTS